MDIYLATATLGLTMGTGFAGALIAAQEYRLQRACRRGWLVTFGITGRQVDLDAQTARLEELHAGARGVGNKAAVLPFPGSRKRGA